MELVNELRRKERTEMKKLGFKTKKAYRKWQKKERQLSKKARAAAHHTTAT